MLFTLGTYGFKDFTAVYLVKSGVLSVAVSFSGWGLLLEEVFYYSEGFFRLEEGACLPVGFCLGFDFWALGLEFLDLLFLIIFFYWETFLDLVYVGGLTS